MPEYTISNCTVADAADVARNSMSAFWQDPNWRMLWRKTNLPYVIEQATARGPRNLLKDRDTLRHFKAVDPDTDNVVGYIRWKLPVKYCKTKDGSPTWPDGQTPDVTPDEHAKYVKMAEAAWWETDPSSDVLDPLIVGMKRELFGRKDYVGRYSVAPDKSQTTILSTRYNAYINKVIAVLDYLAVHPEYQGHGAGSALLKHGIQQAQEAGVDIIVLAFSGGFGLYKRMGFQVLDSVTQDASEFGGTDCYTVQIMELEANKQH